MPRTSDPGFEPSNTPVQLRCCEPQLTGRTLGRQMFRIMRARRHASWCQKQGLDLGSAQFHIETCYLGRGLRSRPGSVLLWQGLLTHFSYRWRDTLWALGEPSVRVDIPVRDIVSFAPEAASSELNLMQLFPDGVFVVRVRDGEEHVLILQRDAEEFERLVRGQLDEQAA